MRAGAAAEAIRDRLAATLPAMLSSASLLNFEAYLDEPPRVAEERALCVYVVSETNTQDVHTASVMIQAQLYKVRDANAYHDVIMDAVVDELKPELVEYQNLESIESDVWPFSRNVSSSFLYYEITYSTDLDDCEEG